MLRAFLLGALAVAVVLPSGALAQPRNPWLEQSFIHIAHQGGEDEYPSNTMYAFQRSLARGADMLEIDVNRTSDDRLVVMHDWTVDRTTNGTGYTSDLTLAQIQALDAAYNFVTGRNAVPGLDPSEYPLRGVRSGDVPPPAGYTAEDFRPPSLEEVLAAFPSTPINIEIKGRDDDPAEFRRTAELLAGVLSGTARRDLIVVSFNQEAVDRFHELVPQVDTAPGVGGLTNFILGAGDLPEGTVAVQIPITYRFAGQLLEITTPENVRKAHDAGYAVHTWLSNDEENVRVYDRLLDMCVDGIMAARPRVLERRLRGRDIARPDGEGSDPCSARAASARAKGRRAIVRMRRQGLSEEPYRGSVQLRARRGGRLLARGSFRLREGRERATARLRLTSAGRAAAMDGPVRALARVRTRGARGEPVETKLTLRGAR